MRRRLVVFIDFATAEYSDFLIIMSKLMIRIREIIRASLKIVDLIFWFFN
jgi:hypothetical protein